jgi:membrane peptidoglycan carboxypeptidase
MRRLWRMVVGSVILGALVLSLAAGSVLVQREVKTGDLEARYLSSLAKDLSFEVGPGPSPAMRFPTSGPYDIRLGYASLPDFIQRLLVDGFSITAQARPSPTLIRLVDFGLFATYREKIQAGLTLIDRDNAVMFSALDPTQVYPDFQSIPPLVLRSLLFIENRELLAEQYPRRNPAVEWDRLGRAVLEQLAHALGSRSHVSGGSTLATQLEKYRHSSEGRTLSVLEKARQMASAAVRAYLNGPETLEARQGIAVAYLNSMPLSAAPGYGEIHGLADGLRIWHQADFDRVNRLLRSSPTAQGGGVPQDYAVAYRQVLSLLLAQRRPAFYLGPGSSSPPFATPR